MLLPKQEVYSVVREIRRAISVQLKESRSVSRMKHVGICETGRDTANALTNVKHVTDGTGFCNLRYFYFIDQIISVLEGKGK